MIERSEYMELVAELQAIATALQAGFVRGEQRRALIARESQIIDKLYPSGFAMTTTRLDRQGEGPPAYHTPLASVELHDDIVQEAMFERYDELQRQARTAFDLDDLHASMALLDEAERLETRRQDRFETERPDA